MSMVENQESGRFNNHLRVITELMIIINVSVL